MKTYEELRKINVNEHVEKKGKFAYLSWTWAVDALRKECPTATWEVIRFNGLPFLSTEVGYFVEVAVTVDGITLSQIHPVLDNNNKPITVPNSFQINTSIQRCLVKAISLHGLGLYIFAGEDLPEEGRPELLSDDQITAVQDAATEAGITTLAICKAAKVDSIAKIEADRFDGLIEWINKQIKKAA